MRLDTLRAGANSNSLHDWHPDRTMKRVPRHRWLAIRDLHAEYGHIQEVIVQNFRAKERTFAMAKASSRHRKSPCGPLPGVFDLGPDMSIQAPPNSPGN